MFSHTDEKNSGHWFFSILSRSCLSRPEKFSGQSRLSHGTGKTGFFGIQDCPAGL